jgi:hypothetical protein
MLFILFGYGGQDARKWKATLMERQGMQGLKRKSSSEIKYLVFDVLFDEWIFLWLFGRENKLEHTCLEVFGLMGGMPLVGVFK